MEHGVPPGEARLMTHVPTQAVRAGTDGQGRSRRLGLTRLSLIPGVGSRESSACNQSTHPPPTPNERQKEKNKTKRKKTNKQTKTKAEQERENEARGGDREGDSQKERETA